MVQSQAVAVATPEAAPLEIPEDVKILHSVETESTEQEDSAHQTSESETASEKAQESGDDESVKEAAAKEPNFDELWEVVGGVGKGGIIVRTDRDPASPQAEERLSTGSIVVGLEREGARIRYQKVSGSGPATGWVCIQVNGKDLLLKVKGGNTGALSEEVLRRYSERFGKADQGKGQFNRQSFGWRMDGNFAPQQDSQMQRMETYLELEQDLGIEIGAISGKDSLCGPPRPLAYTGEPAQRELVPTFGYAGSLDRSPPFARYDIRDRLCMRVGGFTHGQVVCDQGGAEYAVIGVRKSEGIMRLWFQPLCLDRRAAGAFPHATLTTLRQQLTVVPDRRHKFEEAMPEAFEAAEDSDGEEVMLCPHCRLPVGQSGYYDKEKRDALLHGECMAQVMLHQLKDEETKRQQEEATLKRTRRAEYDIGWSVARIPRNLGPAMKLQCSPLPKGMCCLVYNRFNRTLSVAATFEPAAAINLEYLSLALKVRALHGREPLFSLDPLEPKEKTDEALLNYKDEMQIKRFEPEWLNGTSAGEVMFQADYHLKELSMGEYEQPIVGMKSCHDLSEAEGDDMEWRAREWFVVRKAEVQLSEDNVLIPYVRMGVEAWEQVMGPNGLEDAKITRPDHPLVKYAESFTHNFDLIAERKSVIYHLRELAKASVMAKFMLEAGVHLDDTWFELAAEANPNSKLEIPQLWNERARAQIRVHNGAIVGAEKGVAPKLHGVYGGVEFGLDRFKVSAARPLGRTLQPTLLSASARAVTSRASLVGAPYYRPSVTRPTIAPISALGGISGMPGLRPSLVSAPHALVSAGHEPMGVDLNLDRFDLTDVTEVSAERKLGTWAAAEACASIGDAFWAGLEESKALFKDEDRKLLKDIYNPYMSDRRLEGDLFCPPDTSFAYVTQLRQLLKEEELVRKQRKEHFLSDAFAMSEPGALFPYSWTTAFEIAHGSTDEKAPNLHGSMLHARPDYKKETAVMEYILNNAAPIFDKTTEDGCRFRIYRFGSLEVRTTQEHDGQEVVGVVYSIRAPRKLYMSCRQAFSAGSSTEKFVKVTEYVERAHSGALMAAQEAEKAANLCPSRRRSYVVLETEQGNFVVTEKLANGVVTWDENPKDLEDRISLAKVIRSAECSIPVKDMRQYQTQEAYRLDCRGTSESKRYAQGAFSWAQGDQVSTYSGFGKPMGSSRWRLHAAVVTTQKRSQRPESN